MVVSVYQKTELKKECVDDNELELKRTLSKEKPFHKTTVYRPTLFF